MKFRKRPVVIEAMPWDGSSKSIHIIADWADPGPHPLVGHKCIVDILETSLNVLSVGIHTLEGYMAVSPGDWVIKGVKGEFYPCKPDIFEATYEAVEVKHD